MIFSEIKTTLFGVLFLHQDGSDLLKRRQVPLTRTGSSGSRRQADSLGKFIAVFELDSRSLNLHDIISFE